MKRSLFIFLLIFIVLPLLVSGEDLKKFGKYDPKFLALTHYEEDTTAAAIKIFDVILIDISVKREVEIRYDRHFSYKILKNSALSYGSIAIPYFHKARIWDIKAQVVHPDGKVFKLDKDNIFDEEAKNETKVKKFVLPNLEVGSIFEVKYTLRSSQVFLLDPWYFHDEIPVLESEVVLQLSPFFTYLATVSNDPTQIIEYQDEKYYKIDQDKWLSRNHFKAVNLPAIKDEPYISSLKNYKTRIDLQIRSYGPPENIHVFIKDIQTLCNTLLEESFKNFEKPEDDVAKIVKSLIRDNMSGDIKAKILFEYVRDYFLDSDYDWGIFPRYDQKKLLETKKASASEKNLMLMVMLRAAGFDVIPILISTRGHGEANPEIPFLSQYDKTILRVHIRNQNHLFDAGSPWITYGQLPAESLAENAMLVVKDNTSFMKNPNTGLRSYETVESTYEISNEGLLKGRSALKSIGYAALNRNQQLFKHKKFDKLVVNDIADNSDKYTVTVYDSSLQPVPCDTFKTRFESELSDYAEIIDHEIYLKPALLFGEETNIFRSEKRSFPVEFAYRFKEIELNHFVLPDGYILTEMPKEIVIGNKYFRYHRTTVVESQKPFTIRYSRQFEVKELKVPPSDYSIIRNDFAKIVDADQEVLIIKSGN